MNELKNEMAELQKNNKKRFFIIKPEASCQGKGIMLIKHWSEINWSEETR